MAASMARVLPFTRFILRNSVNRNLNKSKCCYHKQYTKQLESKSSRREYFGQKEKRISEYPGYEISTEDFIHVERLLPKPLIPSPPEGAEFPMPSGWIPQTAKVEENTFWIRRTKNHMMPVYLIKKPSGQILTVIRKVDGDIFKLNSEIQAYLQKDSEIKIHTQVHEVARKLIVRGNHIRKVADFLLAKGF